MLFVYIPISPLYRFFVVFLQAENRFITQNEDHVNNLNRAHFTLWCSNYWLTNRVRLIGALVCFLVGIFLVASVRTHLGLLRVKVI